MTEPIPLELWALDGLLEDVAADCYAGHAAPAREIEDVPGGGML